MTSCKALTAHALAVAVMTVTGGAQAAGNPMAFINLGVQPVAPELLERQRGGFIDKEGFKVQIGLQKMTLVDGMVVAKSRLVIPDINVRQNVDKALENLDQAKADMDQAMMQMDEQLESAIGAVKQVFESPEILTDKGVSADEQTVLKDLSSSLGQVQQLPKTITKSTDQAQSVAHQLADTALNGDDYSVTSSASNHHTSSQVKTTQTSVYPSGSSSAPVPTIQSTAELPQNSPLQNTAPQNTASQNTASQSDLNDSARELVSARQQNPVLDVQPSLKQSLPDSMMLEQALTQVIQTESATIIQNSADSRLIQTYNVLNIELSNLTSQRIHGLQNRLLPYMIFYSR